MFVQLSFAIIVPTLFFGRNIMSETDSNFDVLIVDDNPVTMDLLRHYLSAENYHISETDSGDKALPLIEQLKPDVVLLDVMMPGIDGYETCRRLKNNPKTAAIPVIFVTARVAPRDIAEGFAVGGSDYIGKPIQREEVLARVAYQLKLKQQLCMERELALKAQKMSALGGLVSSIAHEISTPLGTLNTALSYTYDEADTLQKALNEKTLTPAKLDNFLLNLKEALGISQTNIESASRILHSFQLVAIDQCRYTVSTFNLAEYIDNVVLSLKPNLKQTSHEIHINIARDITVTTYPGAISQIITNLMNNSVLHGYTPGQSGHINITATTQNGQVELIYQDDGLGMSSETLEKVFEPYYTTKANKGGSGLGMGIILKLIEKDLEGTVKIESKLGEGVKVMIGFPIEKGQS
ncbi:MAG: CheY-like chemotaxis protein/anti-sigma regulatory factor (Ser/Thr protein kinase) [Phenylobacterium sp.]